jgi:hypothetical protein
MLLSLPFILLVSPITWHNYRVSGRFILLSDNFGVNLFTGNNPDAQGFDSLAQAQSQPAAIRYIAVNEAVKAGQTTLPAEVLRYIREQPADWLALLVKKVWLWFGEVDERLISPYFPLTVAHSRLLGSLPLEWQALAIVALLGLCLAWPETKSGRGLVLLCLIYGGLSLVTIIFFIQLRFRLPFVPFVLLTAASFLAAAPTWQRRRPRRFWGGLAAMLLLYPFVPGLALFILLFIAIAEIGNGSESKVHFGLRSFSLWGQARPGDHPLGKPVRAPNTLRCRSQRDRLYYSLLASIGLYLLAVGLWVRAERLASDVSQTIDHYLGPPLAASGIIGQTFQMDCDGLNRIEITLGLLGEPHDQPVTFYLVTDPSAQEILFSETFAGRQVKDYQKRTFHFPPIPGSTGRTFFFFLASPTSTPQNALTARGYTDTPVDYYPSGQAMAGHPNSLQRLQADFAFTAFCDLSPWQKLQAVFEE